MLMMALLACASPSHVLPINLISTFHSKNVLWIIMLDRFSLPSCTGMARINFANFAYDAFISVSSNVPEIGFTRFDTARNKLAPLGVIGFLV
jgi:hypothetical protein